MHVDEIHSFGINLAFRTIYLDSGDDGIDQPTLARFLKNMDIVEADMSQINQNPVGHIEIISNSIGGDYDCAVGIYDRIKSAKYPVDIYCYGCALSGGSLIPQACRTRYISKNCSFMIHTGSLEFNMEYNSASKYLEYANKRNDRMIELYAERMTMPDPKQFLINHLHSDFYLTAEQAVEFGLMDQII